MQNSNSTEIQDFSINLQEVRLLATTLTLTLSRLPGDISFQPSMLLELLERIQADLNKADHILRQLELAHASIRNASKCIGSGIQAWFPAKDNDPKERRLDYDNTRY